MDKILILGSNSMMLYHHRRELIAAIQENGYKVVVAAPMDPESKNLVKLGCEFYPINVESRGTNIKSDMTAIRDIVSMLRKVRPSLVLTFYTKTNIYGGTACRFLKIPYIENITGLGSALSRGGGVQKIMLYLYRIALRDADTVFFQNKSNHSLFLERGFKMRHTELIPGSGVNLEHFKPLPYPEKGEPVQVLYVSRIMKEKGIDEVLEAAKIVKANHPEVRFHIVGPAQNDYLPILKKAEAEGLIEYHGKVHDTGPCFEKTHVTVLPSYYPEGMANVLLESSASARPIITTPKPGCGETLDEGVTGFLAEPKDAKSLAAAIEHFISLPYEQQREMGLAARRKMEKEFDRNIVINAYLAAIRRALEKRK